MWNRWLYLAEKWLIELMKLLALLIAFGLFKAIDKSQGLQSFQWFHNLKKLVLSKLGLSSPWLNVVVIFLPIIILVGYLSHSLHNYQGHQLGYLLFNCVVLFYCLGPTNLDSLQPQQSDPAPAEEPQLIINRFTDASIHRWFAIFFWFVVLGAAGAIGYRLFRQALNEEQRENTPLQAVITRVIYILEYPVIIIMAVSLLIASDFDRIWRHCRTYFKRTQWYQFHIPFLYEAMDFAVENCEIDAEKPYSQQTLESTTLSVLKRMLMVWLVLVTFIILLTIG